MKKLKISLFLLLSSLSLNSFAVGWASGTGTITGYYVWSGSTAFIRVTNQQNPDNCTGGGYLALDATQANFKSMWAQVMAAQASGQTVQLFYNGCFAGYPLISAIAIPAVW